MVFVILDRCHANWPLQVIMTLTTMAWLHTLAKVLQLVEAKKNSICIKNSKDRLVSQLLARLGLGQMHCANHMPHVGHM